MTKTVKDFMSLPYSMIVKRDPADCIFVAKVSELPGCSGHGATAEEALKMLEENMEVWIETCLESGVAIPEPVPSSDDLPSGKWLQRVPRSLHAALVRLAEQDDISLNQFIASVLAIEVGRRSNQTEKTTVAEVTAAGHEKTDRWGATKHHIVWRFSRNASHPYQSNEDEFLHQLLTNVPAKVSKREGLGNIDHEGHKIWEN
jgi:antitoxin HicB